MKKIYILLVLTGLISYSCGWDDYGDYVVNSNASTTPKTSALLTNSMLSLGGTITATQGALYVQYIANSQYTSADNYTTVNFSSDGFYSGPLADLQKIIDMNTNEETMAEAARDGSNTNQIAIARILQSYYYLHMTNRWGDLPYSDALKGAAAEPVITPEYDTQEAIYDGCIQTLKDAVAMIDASGDPISGDILFGGDMDMWEKFANTTRLIAAARLSEVSPSKAATEFASAYSDGVIALDNSENISYRYLAVQTYENPYYNSFVTSGRKDWTIADPLMNYMQIDTYTSPHPGAKGSGMMDVIADPRLPVYANPVENTTTYVGMPYGLTEAAAGSISNSAVSFLGDAFRMQDTPADIYTSAQVAFTLAEGVERRWITGDVQTFYEQGIQASLAQHGVDADYATYITNSEVAFDASRAIEQIAYQKWVAIFPNGYEAWAEWRRLGFPTLAPADNAQNESGEIPTRQGYSTSERDLNSSNYNDAISNQGWAADDLDGKLWWDAN